MKKKTPKLKVELNKFQDFKWNLTVKSEGEIFGPQPFLALRTRDGKYYWENFDFIKKGREWRFALSTPEHAPIGLIDKIGVAANSSTGHTEESFECR